MQFLTEHFSYSCIFEVGALKVTTVSLSLVGNIS
jgi:hypothetical protein